MNRSCSTPCCWPVKSFPALCCHAMDHHCSFIAGQSKEACNVISLLEAPKEDALTCFETLNESFLVLSRSSTNFASKPLVVVKPRPVVQVMQVLDAPQRRFVKRITMDRVVHISSRLYRLTCPVARAPLIPANRELDLLWKSTLTKPVFRDVCARWPQPQPEEHVLVEITQQALKAWRPTQMDASLSQGVHRAHADLF